MLSKISRIDYLIYLFCVEFSTSYPIKSYNPESGSLKVFLFKLNLPVRFDVDNQL